jgi:hypothetical protein
MKSWGHEYDGSFIEHIVVPFVASAVKTHVRRDAVTIHTGYEDECGLRMWLRKPSDMIGLASVVINLALNLVP